ncbi:hypothetical protein MRX96_042959 [Rhipicephalus microplus]
MRGTSVEGSATVAHLKFYAQDDIVDGVYQDVREVLSTEIRRTPSQTESSSAAEAYLERCSGSLDFCGQPFWQKEVRALHSPSDSCACRTSSGLSGKASDMPLTT